MPVENFEFWTEKLRELTEKRNRGTSTGLGWSRLSSKFFSPKRQESSQQPKNRPSVYDHRQGEKGSFYPNFMELWKKKNGFDVIERTVGCSARYHGEPLLWVYPSYFQLAPEGKGNRHHRELKERLYANFPEANGKGTIQFAAHYINWERFESFVLEVQRIEDESR